MGVIGEEGAVFSCQLFLLFGCRRPYYALFRVVPTWHLILLPVCLLLLVRFCMGLDMML